MFILRTIDSKKRVTNYVLGDFYEKITRFEKYDYFCRNFKAHFGFDHVADLDDGANDQTKSCMGFIVGNCVTPIWKEFDYYIMTESGKTFEKL